MEILISLTRRQYFHFLLFFVILVGVLVGIYIGTSAKASEQLLEANLQRQLGVTLTGSYAIRDFLDWSKKSVLLMAENYRLSKDVESRKEVLRRFIEDRRGTPLVGVAVTDKKGVIVANYARDGSNSVGVDVSDRDYMTWARTAAIDEVLVSKPFVSRTGSSKGREVIALVVPLRSTTGDFEGVIIAPILMDEFVEQYLSVFDQKTRVYLLDSEATFLVAPEQDIVGQSALKILEEKPFLGSDVIADRLQSTLTTKEPGKADMFMPKMEGVGLERMLITYAPIKDFPHMDQSWMIIVVSPVDAVLSQAAPIYIQLITIVVAFFFLLLFIALTLMRLIEVRTE